MVLPVVTTVVVALAIGVAVIREQQRQVQAAESADAVAEQFTQEVQEFRQGVARVIEEGREGPAAELQARVGEAVATPPVLPELASEGARRSSAYRDAQYTEATLLDPYVELLDTLGRAALAETYIAAADEVLALRIENIIGPGPIRDTAPVENEVIPAFTSGLRQYDEVTVPPGQEELADVVRSAVQNVVDQCRLLITFAALGENYSFSYGAQIAAASEAVRAYELEVEADVATAIDATDVG